MLMKRILIQICLAYLVYADGQYGMHKRHERSAVQIDGVLPIKDIINSKVDELPSNTVFDNLITKVDFKAPGRRISEAKCLQFVWETKFLELVDKMLYGKKSIIGGRPAIYGEIPHMGAIGWRSANNITKWVYKCGATLVSERFLLTAAHCSRTVRGDSSVTSSYPEIVKFGDKLTISRYHETMNNALYSSIVDYFSSRRSIGRVRERNIRPLVKYERIKRFIKHDDYHSPKRYYDIAIIELQGSVALSPITRPACLWTNPDTNVLDELIISGWGVVDPVTRETSDVLQVADVNHIPDDVCEDKLKIRQNRNWGGLAEHQMCAGVLRGGVDTCEGDSGGPLQVKMDLWSIRAPFNWPMYYIVGVTSFGYHCARADTPGVYVKISSFIDWIESIVWPDG